MSYNTAYMRNLEIMVQVNLFAKQKNIYKWTLHAKYYGCTKGKRNAAFGSSHLSDQSPGISFLISLCAEHYLGPCVEEK